MSWKILEDQQPELAAFGVSIIGHTDPPIAA